MSGAYDVWLTNWNLAANPVGDNDVGDVMSAAVTVWISVDEAWVAPVGEEKMPARTAAPFLNIDNWHGSMW